MFWIRKTERIQRPELPTLGQVLAHETLTSTFLTPNSWAARPALSDATCAANGVDLREPRNPQPPAVAHERALPWRSVIVMIRIVEGSMNVRYRVDGMLFDLLSFRCVSHLLLSLTF